MQISVPLCAALVLVTTSGVAASKDVPRIGASQVRAKEFGACHLYDPRRPEGPSNSVSPIGAIALFVQDNQRAQLDDAVLDAAAFRFVRRPQHGTIRDANGLTYFVPHVGHTGSDRYEAEVRMQGRVFKVKGEIRASSNVIEDFGVLCRRLGLPGVAWKLSRAAGEPEPQAAR